MSIARVCYQGFFGVVALALMAGCAPDPAPTSVPADELSESSAPVAEVEQRDTTPAAPLRVVARYPLEGRPFKGEAVLYFDQPLATSDAVGNLVTVEPAAGAQVEMGERHIRVAADVGDAEIVAVILADTLSSENGAVIAPTDRAWRWATDSPRAQQVIRSAGTDEFPELTLVFSRAINTDQAQDYIAVVDANNNELPVSVANGGDKRIAVTFQDPPALPVQIHVKAGLPAADGLMNVQQDGVLSFPVVETLKIEDPYWWGGDPGTVFRLRFSERVDASALKESLRVSLDNSDVALAHSLQSIEDGHSYLVNLLKPPPGSFAIRADIDAGLTGIDGALVHESWSARLIHNAQRLAVQYVNWEPGEDYTVQIYFNKALDAEGIDEHFSIRPEVPGLEFAVGASRMLTASGEWRSETQYTLEVKTGYLDSDGIATQQPIRFSFGTGNIPPYLGYAFEGSRYFPRRGDGELIMKSRNIDSITHRMYRLFPNNFVAALDDLRAENFYRLRERWAEKLGEKTVALQNPRDQLKESTVPLDALMPQDARGLFVVEGQPKSGQSEFKLMIHTDIGLTAHWEADHIVAFVHDLVSLEPLEGAQIQAYSERNQLIAQGVADAGGVVRLEGWEGTLGEPAVITAAIAEDFTFLDLQSRNDEIPAKVGARDPYAPDEYDAFLYADRDLYRPGETAHLRWIVRQGYTDAVADVPLKLSVFQPNGTEIFSTAVTPSSRGTGGHDLVTEKTWPTGKYWVRLHAPSGNRDLGSLRINVEEFVPNQIEVALDVPAEYFIAGEAYPVHVSAHHLFGTAASDRLSKVYAILQPGHFTPEGFDGYWFGHEGFNLHDRMEGGELTTDEAGAAEFSLSHPIDHRLTQPVRAQIVAEISEEGGRPVTKTTERLLFGDRTALGIRARTDGTPGNIALDVAAISPDGKASTLNTVTVTLERREWGYYLRRYYDHNSPSFTPKYTKIQEREVQLSNGRGDVSFSVQQWGNYRVRVHSKDTTLYATQQFYHSGYYTTLVKEDAPSLVSIKLDKDRYTVGDSARVMLEAPFEGRAIVAVQNQEIRDLRSVMFADGKAELSVALGEQHFPSAWIEVTAVYAPELGAKATHPFSSFGMAYIPVHNDELEIEIGFPELPEAVRPAQTHDVVVEALIDGAPAANAELTLAAVDAGILNITNYASPAPYSWLMRPRYPDLRRNHYYDSVAYDYVKTAIGGDAAALAKRVGDDMQNWIETVSLWSGTVTTDASGRVTVPLALPEFNGQVRLMAVATTADGAVGGGDASLLVKRPYIMRPSLPRFVDPGDKFQASLTFFNNSEESVSINWQSITDGSLSIDASQGTLEIAGRSEASVKIPLSAEESGAGTVSFEARVSSESGDTLDTLKRTMPLPVRVPAVWQQHRELIVVPPGETSTLENTLFVSDGRLETGVIVSASPELQLFEALEDLIHYPYGCVEQTTSQLMPLYLLRQSPLIESMAGVEVNNIENYLRAGVDALLAMQTPDGGLAYWRGGRDSYPYGSVYALHLLTLIQRDKLIEVPDEPFRLLQAYVTQIGAGETGTSGRYSPSARASVQLQRAYALFVSALGGKLDALNRIEGLVPTDYPRTGRYLLAAALAMHNREHSGIAALLADVPNEMYDARELKGALNSRTRNEAMELLAHTYLSDEPTAQALIAERLTRWLKVERYGSTQEKAFVISALGTYLSKVGENIDQAFATLNGPEGEARLEGGQVLRQSAEGSGNSYSIENEGATPLYVSFMTAGIPLNPPVDSVAEGLAVSRTIQSTDGSAITGAFEQGSTYRVTLKIQPDQRAENVVVADLLPAGFEVENMRLSGISSDAPSASNTYPEYMDVRDDRVILAFHALDARAHTFSYTVRAVTPGTFMHPPVTAECMYDPAIRARSLPGEIVVDAR